MLMQPSLRKSTPSPKGTPPGTLDQQSMCCVLANPVSRLSIRALLLALPLRGLTKSLRQVVSWLGYEAGRVLWLPDGCLHMNIAMCFLRISERKTAQVGTARPPALVAE